MSETGSAAWPPEISESEARELLARPAPPKFKVPEGVERIVLVEPVPPLTGEEWVDLLHKVDAEMAEPDNTPEPF